MKRGTVGLDGDTKHEELVCRRHEVYYDPENKRCVICELRALAASSPAENPPERAATEQDCRERFEDLMHQLAAYERRVDHIEQWLNDTVAEFPFLAQPATKQHVHRDHYGEATQANCLDCQQPATEKLREEVPACLAFSTEGGKAFGCVLPKGHEGAHSAFARHGLSKEEVEWMNAPMGPLEHSQETSAPTLTFDGTHYDCARCGNRQIALCEHWKALFERAHAAIELGKPSPPSAETFDALAIAKQFQARLCGEPAEQHLWWASIQFPDELAAVLRRAFAAGKREGQYGQ